MVIDMEKENKAGILEIFIREVGKMVIDREN